MVPRSEVISTFRCQPTTEIFWRRPNPGVRCHSSWKFTVWG